MYYNRGVLPFLWVQKYSAYFIPTTLMLKKIACGSTARLAVLLIQLPICALATEPGTKKKVISTGLAATYSLQQADSLFARGQYAAVLPLYRAQVWQRQQVSAQLLLRLAYAEHQQGHYAAEMLYLNLALARQPRLGTWRQLVALAQRLRLVGYPNTWQQELRIQVLRYYYPVLQGLLSLAVLAAMGLLLRRGRTSRAGWLAYGAYLLGTGAYLVWLAPAPVGIVSRAGTALMAGPGAGAPWLSTAAPGDRLTVLGHEDIWLRVRWQQRVAYVRAADALVVE